MRLVDLDRDMSDVFPTGTSVDSEFLFRRMAEATLDALETRPGSRVVDVAAGVGQDDRALARRGAWVVGAEPSERMTALAYLSDREDAEPPSGGVARVRAWSEALPFGAGAFDGAFCKGALDHFDDPESCIREMARVTRASGRVVLAVANFDSLTVRISRALERLRGAGGRGRRHHDVPSDHFTRYDPALVREQLERFRVRAARALRVGRSNHGRLAPLGDPRLGEPAREPRSGLGERDAPGRRSHRRPFSIARRRDRDLRAPQVLRLRRRTTRRSPDS
jgi:SAM-dependent methyltransferase